MATPPSQLFQSKNEKNGFITSLNDSKEFQKHNERDRETSIVNNQLNKKKYTPNHFTLQRRRRRHSFHLRTQPYSNIVMKQFNNSNDIEYYENEENENSSKSNNDNDLDITKTTNSFHSVDYNTEQKTLDNDNNIIIDDYNNFLPQPNENDDHECPFCQQKFKYDFLRQTHMLTDNWCSKIYYQTVTVRQNNNRDEYEIDNINDNEENTPCESHEVKENNENLPPPALTFENSNFLDQKIVSDKHQYTFNGNSACTTICGEAAIQFLFGVIPIESIDVNAIDKILECGSRLSFDPKHHSNVLDLIDTIPRFNHHLRGASVVQGVISGDTAFDDALLAMEKMLFTEPMVCGLLTKQPESVLIVIHQRNVHDPSQRRYSLFDSHSRSIPRRQRNATNTADIHGASWHSFTTMESLKQFLIDLFPSLETDESADVQYNTYELTILLPQKGVKYQPLSSAMNQYQTHSVESSSPDNCRQKPLRNQFRNSHSFTDSIFREHIISPDEHDATHIKQNKHLPKSLSSRKKKPLNQQKYVSKIENSHGSIPVFSPKKLTSNYDNPSNNFEKHNNIKNQYSPSFLSSGKQKSETVPPQMKFKHKNRSFNMKIHSNPQHNQKLLASPDPTNEVPKTHINVEEKHQELYNWQKKLEKREKYLDRRDKNITVKEQHLSRRRKMFKEMFDGLRLLVLQMDDKITQLERETLSEPNYEFQDLSEDEDEDDDEDEES